MTPDGEFAALLRTERLIAGLTQEQVVERMNALGYSNFHQATVFKIESGQRRVTVGEAYSLAKVLDVPLAHLLPHEGSVNAPGDAVASAARKDLADQLTKLQRTIERLRGSSRG